MFLQKIDRLATDWDLPPRAVEGIARESLLYGMRLVRHPSALKRELKKLRISSLIAKPLWSGNAYLLHVLPEVLCNRKKKIPCLADFHFARRTLSSQHLKEIKARQKKLCKITPEALFLDLLPKIKRSAWKGRFIPQFDQMNENLKDIEQDLAVRALEVVNKEVTNFKTTDRDEIGKYLQFCVGKKTDTYLKERTPRQIKVRIDEPERFDRVVHAERANEMGQDMTFQEVEFKQDLQTLLQPKVYRGIALLMNFADAQDARQFDRYLRERNIKAEWVTQTQMKNHIEKFLNFPVFEKVMENPTLKQFLLGRIKQQGDGDAIDGEYAQCHGV